MLRSALSYGLVAALALAGCAEDSDDDSTGSLDASPLGPVDAGRPDATATTDALVPNEGGACNTLTYANFGKALFENNCLSCHSAMPYQNSNRFDTVEIIRMRKQDIIDHAVEPRKEPKMPKGGALSAGDQANLKTWLNCGAP